MFKTACSNCDFSAESTLHPKIEECPICSSELFLDEEEPQIIGLPDLTDQSFEIEVEGYTFPFKFIRPIYRLAVKKGKRIKYLLNGCP